MKKVADTISSKNNVFADLKQVREDERNKNRENSANLDDAASLLVKKNFGSKINPSSP